jgi:hypothetical protein
MYDFSTSFVLCIWIYGNKNDDDDPLLVFTKDWPATLIPSLLPYE